MKAHPKILVVDNDRNILAALRLSLTAECYRLIGCSSAAEALNKLQRGNVDLVVTEIHVNGVVESGFTFLTTLRHDTPHLPIIVISNCLDRDVEKRLISLGIKAIFSKPLELRLLRRTMRTLLIGSGLRPRRGVLGSKTKSQSPPAIIARCWRAGTIPKTI